VVEIAAIKSEGGEKWRANGYKVAPHNPHNLVGTLGRNLEEVI